MTLMRPPEKTVSQCDVCNAREARWSLKPINCPWCGEGTMRPVEEEQ